MGHRGLCRNDGSAVEPAARRGDDSPVRVGCPEGKDRGAVARHPGDDAAPARCDEKLRPDYRPDLSRHSGPRVAVLPAAAGAGLRVRGYGGSAQAVRRRADDRTRNGGRSAAPKSPGTDDQTGRRAGDAPAQCPPDDHGRGTESGQTVPAAAGGTDPAAAGRHANRKNDCGRCGSHDGHERTVQRGDHQTDPGKCGQHDSLVRKSVSGLAIGRNREKTDQTTRKQGLQKNEEARLCAEGAAQSAGSCGRPDRGVPKQRPERKPIHTD